MDKFLVPKMDGRVLRGECVEGLKVNIPKFNGNKIHFIPTPLCCTLEKKKKQKRVLSFVKRRKFFDFSPQIIKIRSLSVFHSLVEQERDNLCWSLQNINSSWNSCWISLMNYKMPIYESSCSISFIILDQKLNSY